VTAKITGLVLSFKNHNLGFHFFFFSKKKKVMPGRYGTLREAIDAKSGGEMIWAVDWTRERDGVASYSIYYFVSH
jgi:hypothetical protein